MIVNILDENGNDIVLPYALNVRALRYETAAQGGPSWAELRVDGDAVSLWQCLHWLAYRAYILDERGVKVWWGQINDIELSVGAVSFGVSLDTMANSVSVIWANDAVGGMTDYVVDQDSIDRYGTKQLLISGNSADEAAAEQRRDWEIQRRRYPTPKVRPGQSGNMYALIRCNGWFQTLGRTYYERAEGLVEYVPVTGSAQRLGWKFTTDQIGFTARGRTVSDGNGYITSLTAGEKFRVSGSSSNNTTFTVESSSERTPDSLTASTIAFLQQERRANDEYLRASHGNERKLNNFNLYSATTTLGATTTASGITGAHDGSNDASVLTDSGESWTTDVWAGRRIVNVTDGSEGTIKSNTATTITVNLYGGQDNDWDAGDVYIISHDEIWIDDTSVVQNGDRIRIELDAGGYFETFVRGTPDSGSGRVLVDGNIPSLVIQTADVIRVNRWVTSENRETFYVEGDDYTIGATDGTITTDSGGAISNNAVIKVSYIYTEYRVEDSDLGLSFLNAGDMMKVTGGSNAGWYRVISTSSEGDRVTVRESVLNAAPGTSITISRGSNITVTAAPTDEFPGSTATVYAYGWSLAQSFTIPSDDDWYFYTVEIQARKMGAPADNLRVRIFTDSSGAPGSSLESAIVSGSSLSSQSAWVTFDFTGSNLLESGTTYWLVIDRSGSGSAEDYYEVTVDEDKSYADGELLVSDGTDWQTRPIDADLPFRILGKEETTAQISEIVTRESEYLTGVDIIDTSGVETNQYRNGRTTAYSELLDLLEIGTTNDRRLLATVAPDLSLRIEEEPTQPEIPDYQLGVDGHIYTKFGEPIPHGYMHFVGKWISVGMISGMTEWGSMNAPAPFLVESAQYDVETMTYRLEPANGDPVWRIGMRLDEG